MKDILNHHAKTADLGPDEKRILDRLLSRAQAQEDMIPQTVHASRGFMRIERVAQAKPVSLFGQSVGSFAHNRIVVHFGTEGDDGTTAPGAPLMTALISEESLAQLMMSPNRSNAHVALTAESWLGETMPNWEGKKIRPDDLLDAAMEKTLRSRRRAADALKKMAADMKSGISKAKQQDMKILLDQVLAKGDAAFRLERHKDNLQRTLVQNRVEASTAALNLPGIARAAQEDPLSLEGGSDITDPELARDRNGLLDAAMERYRLPEAELAYEATISYMRHILAQDHPDCTYVPGPDDPHGQKLRNALRDEDRAAVKKLEGLASLAASLSNPHTNERRAAADGFALTASTAFIGGGEADLHSSFPATDGGYFTLRIETAHVENSFGNEKIRDGSRVVELGLSPEDMMTALRGHPTGADIPCSIDNVGGISLPRHKLESEIEAVIQSDPARGDVAEARRSLETLISQANAIIQDGAKRAADRKELTDLIERIDLTMETFSEVELRDVQGRAGAMNHLVQEMNQGALKAINEYVLEHHGTELPMMIARDREDPDFSY